MENFNALRISSPQKSFLSISPVLIETRYENKSVGVKLKNEEDILKLPELFAFFLSKYGIETELIFKDDTNA